MLGHPLLELQTNKLLGEPADLKPIDDFSFFLTVCEDYSYMGDANSWYPKHFTIVYVFLVAFILHFTELARLKIKQYYVNYIVYEHCSNFKDNEL